MERAVAGDPIQLESLLRAAAVRLRSELEIGARFRRSLDVEDILQVTFLEAFLRIRSLQQRTSSGFYAWLRQMAQHNLIDAVRWLERDCRPDAKKRVTRGAAGESARTLLLSIAEDKTTVSGGAELGDEVSRLHRAIAQLPSSYRIVIERIDLAESPVADVAAQMGRSEGAIHMLRARAHDRLHELLAR